MKKTWLLLLGLFSTVVMAVEPGERLAPWTLLDQFEQPYSLDEQLQVLLVARDMEGAKLLEAALQGKPKGYLEQRHALFLADISRMPGPIASLFAVPAMRDYSYRVLLDRQARVVPRYPAAAATVLWLDLREGRLLAQRSFTDASALAAALEQAGP
ncbi:FAD/FMN-containing dehydrogenase [Pseudomonas sp. J452]|uniref:FAD/FMN-containing dehydrogenase n=1 Tax=Pseudomonas sp. J452 TaxID=2898441 RepID=UPI0021AD85F8|nr:FAD/FMN-containing dehydrogenase [Pseudomonas sp. J452]UUY08527.1 FAD/FMN-containing dehydrogenase [Pseudomonas sp. J452]